MRRARTLALLFAICLAASAIAHAQMKIRKDDPKKQTSDAREKSVKPVPSATQTAPPPQQELAAEVEMPTNETAATPIDESKAVVRASTDTTLADAAAAPKDPGAWPLVIGGLLITLLFVLAVVGFLWQLGTVESKLTAKLNWQERDAADREKRQQNDLSLCKTELRADIESLRSAMRNIAVETDRLIAPRFRPPEKTPTHPTLPSAFESYEEPDRRGTEDGIDQLLVMANRIVQENSTTLDNFRARTAALAARVSAYPNASEGVPAAFIVEHRDSCYAIPNVVKPARLPQEWFNRSEFGVNDEIHRVVSLPRLKRRGDGYDVQEPGVFER